MEAKFQNVPHTERFVKQNVKNTSTRQNFLSNKINNFFSLLFNILWIISQL